MGETFAFSQRGEEHEKFAPGVADGMIGRRFPVKFEGRESVEGAVVAAEVLDDGTLLWVTVEVPDGTLPKAPLSDYSTRLACSAGQ
jgi:hypothetical protein